MVLRSVVPAVHGGVNQGQMRRETTVFANELQFPHYQNKQVHCNGSEKAEDTLGAQCGKWTFVGQYGVPI